MPPVSSLPRPVGAVRLLACVAAFVAAVAALHAQRAPSSPQPPNYVVDATWPKELPNGWVMGQVGGMAVDAQDRIWVFQRPRSLTDDERGAALTPPVSACCKPAPSVLVFDKAGNLVKSWGGPGFVPNWPASEHAIYVDRANNVWLAGNAAAGNTPEDRVILKFDGDGKLLATYGRPQEGADNNQATDYFGRIASFDADEAAGELYVADGYGNRRLAVLDMRSGAFKRGWGAYGIPLAEISNAPTLPAYAPGQPAAKQFLGPVHCVRLSRDGFVYVCDRTSNRVQVFTKDGTFVKEFIVAPETRGNGSVWTVNFSSDPQQRFLLVGDGRNNVVWILDRDTGAVRGSFGHNGRNAGQFHWVHAIVADSDGNLYTGEVDTGKRIQKFTLRK